MSTNFLQWNPAALNQDSDAQYLVDPLRTGGAPIGGILPSMAFNKAVYQSSTFVAALALALSLKGYNVQDADESVLAAVLANIQTSADLNNPLLFQPFSPTPTFNLSKVGGVYMPLSGNTVLASPTGLQNGQQVMFAFGQDGTGGRTVTYAPNMQGWSRIDPGPNVTSYQLFEFNGFTGFLDAIGPVVSNEGSLFTNALIVTQGIAAQGIGLSGSATIGTSLTIGTTLAVSGLSTLAGLIATTITTSGLVNAASLVVGGSAVTGRHLIGNGTSYVGKTMTLVNVTGSRSFGSTFTNSSGGEVWVSAVMLRGSGSGDTRLNGIVNGIVVNSNTTTSTISGASLSVFFIVPAGATYEVVAAGLSGSPAFSLQQWTEWSYA